MYVSAANARALDLYEDVIVANLRDRKLFNLKVLGGCQHGNTRGCRNRRKILGRGRPAVFHAVKHRTDNACNFICIYFHLNETSYIEINN